MQVKDGSGGPGGADGADGADGSSGLSGAAALGPCAGIPAEHMDFVRQVLDRVGDKWSLLVIAVLEAGPLRYTDLQRQVPGISQRMLSLTLRQLQQDGLIERTAYAEVPPRVEYTITPLGRSLRELVTPLIGWAAAHHDEIRAHRARTAAAPTSPPTWLKSVQLKVPGRTAVAPSEPRRARSCRPLGSASR